ncbi:MAG TPA: ankyrin repeat domain-containing protein [Pyrinomonadaceae bacterium]|nr:ankyrin repeat domain-containing protein [Pyrinomonadaceae bacterium]HMP65545.1 ankyrin repeat domain-containing protein [Pyrinomonadaceae bacterium]
MPKYRPNISVASPCDEAWEEMIGNDQVRFCSHCEKNVNNLSRMSRQEAVRLVKRSGGDLCIRYYEHPQSRAPLFAEELYQITRRAPRLAAGVLGTTLSLASLGYSQGSPIPMRTSVERSAESAEDKLDLATSKGAAKIFGTIFDPNGAPVAGVSITAKQAGSRAEAVVISGEDGGFEIGGLAAGTYVLEIEGPAGFDARTLGNIALADGDKRFLPITLEPVEIVAVSGVVTFSRVADFRTELASAVYAEDLESVLELLAAGADPNGEEEDGDTPIFISAEDDTVDIARALLSYGARANHVNEKGQNALFRVAEEGSLDMAKLLIAHGADVNQADQRGKTPLILAAEWSGPDVVKALLDAGAKIEVADNRGWTALMQAAWEESVEKVRLLLIAGAKVNAKNKKGETAWNLAHQEDVQDLLVSYGATVDHEVHGSDEDDDSEDP